MLSARQIAFRVLVWFVAGFLLLFCLRLGYLYCFTDDRVNTVPRVSSQSMLGMLSSFGGGIKNYATLPRKINASVADGRPVTGVGQKYEKIANVGLKSKEFENNEARVRALVESDDALIQFEQRTGLKGDRRLQLAIGVVPSRFDTFVEAVRTYGELTSLKINKTDKTNEFRELNAKRVSLEKTRAALSELKSREGKIGDLVALENQILALEERIQTLGVSLGDFDTENEFVTVKVLLLEVGNSVAKAWQFPHHAFRALKWSVEVYAYSWFALVCALVAAFIGVHLLRLGVRLVAHDTASRERG